MTDKRYYAACNGKDGFISYFDNLFFGENIKRRYIIKGGPGCGKSTLMRKIAEKAKELGYDVEEFFCSSDIFSLDGIIIEDVEIGIFDATAPHSYDCKFPGCADTLIDLGIFWDENKLKEHSETVKALNMLKSENYKNAYAFLKSAGVVFDNLKAYYTKHLLRDKMIKSAISYSKKQRIGNMRVKSRIVTSISADGIHTENSFCKDAESIYYIEDNICFGPEFLKAVIENAHSEITVCKNPFDIILPEAVYFENEKTLFTTNKNLIGDKKFKTIHSSRFYDEDIKKDRAKIGFEKKCVKELISHACEYFKAAKDAHFEIEKIYTGAIDFEKKEKWSENFISNLFSED